MLVVGGGWSLARLGLVELDQALLDSDQALPDLDKFCHLIITGEWVGGGGL